MAVTDTLDRLLGQLAAQEDAVCLRWVARAEENEDEADGESGFWLSLEHRIDQWVCGYRIQPDEAMEWAIVASGVAPVAAAQALEMLIERDWSV